MSCLLKKITDQTLPITDISSEGADFKVLEKEVEMKDLRYGVGRPVFPLRMQGQADSYGLTIGDGMSPASSMESKASIFKRNISPDLRSNNSIIECLSPSALRRAHLETDHATTSKEQLRCHPLLLKPREPSTPNISKTRLPEQGNTVSSSQPQPEQSRGMVAISMTSESIKRNDCDVIVAGPKKRKTDYRSVKMILIVFVAFALTYLPFTLINLADQRSELHRNWYMITSLGFWAESSVNPVIYGITNRQFRAAYRSMIVDGCRK